jgi:isocitrate dehydrogenase
LAIPKVDAAPDYVRAAERRVTGVDIFVESAQSPDSLGGALERAAEGSAFRLHLISSRGAKVYPCVETTVDYVDAWQCRFMVRDGVGEPSDGDLLDLLRRTGACAPWVHLEKLQAFDGEPAFSRAQGEE